MRFAVIPTRDRPDDLIRCIESIAGQVDGIIIVNNGDAKLDAGLLDHLCDVMETSTSDTFFCELHRPMQPPNLSFLWNEGIRKARDFALVNEGEEAWVAVLNDDAIVPVGWFDAVESAMKTTGAVAGSSGYPYGGILREQWCHLITPINAVNMRLQGWAFIIGPTGPLANEDLRWWFGDTDIDMRARVTGGTVLIDGYPVQNTRANSTTVGALAEQAGRDRATYESIHGPITWWPGG